MRIMQDATGGGALGPPKGWRRRMGGYIHHASGVQVVREVCWDVPTSEPKWVVRDHTSMNAGMFERLAEAMAYVEATHQLQDE